MQGLIIMTLYINVGHDFSETNLNNVRQLSMITQTLTPRACPTILHLLR